MDTRVLQGFMNGERRLCEGLVVVDGFGFEAFKLLFLHLINFDFYLLSILPVG